MVVDRLVTHAGLLVEDDFRAAQGVMGWATRLASMPSGPERTRVSTTLEEMILKPRCSEWDAMAILRQYDLLGDGK